MLVDFKKLMLARFLFTLAVTMQAIVLGWQMYELTKDPFLLGMIGLTEAVPALSLALFAGYIVDRGRPLVIYRRLIFVSFLSALIMLASQMRSFDLTTQARVISLFCSSFLTGLARAFSQPSIYATVPRIIDRNQLTKSSAWMSTAMQVARISGPALGGILYGFIGVSGTSTLICLSLIGASISMLLIKIKLDPLPPSKEHHSIKDELLSGARFVFKHPILFPAMSLDMISVFFGGVTALLPVFAAEILMIGPQGLGLLRAAPAFGAAITSFWLTSKDFRHQAGPWLFSSVAGFGACILVFAISQNYFLSLGALALSGAFDSVSMVIRTSAVQLCSPDSMRGKISAVNSIFIGSSNELGEFESGTAAKLMGTVPSVIFGGVVCIATVGLTAIFAPKLRRLNLHHLKDSH